MPGWRRTLTQVLASGALTLLALGAVELGLAAADLPASGLYAGDPASVWWLRPGLDREVDDPLTGRRFTVRTDGQGRRGPAPPETGPWVLALGCSTTFGWAVERDEAWPAQLEALLQVPVVNGGQPGWSTHQARAHALPWLDEGPAVVVLGFLIRDAWRSGRADRAGRPTPWLHRRRLARLLRPRPAPGPDATGGPPPTGAFRVSPADFRTNLEALLQRTGQARPILLEFPHQHDVTEHAMVLRTLAGERALPLISPQVTAADFVPGDPVHLDAAAHGTVAAALAPAVQAALGGVSLPVPAP